MRDNPELELNPADNDSKRCIFILHAMTTKEGCDRGSEVGPVHSGRGGKGPVLCGNLRNLV